MWYRLLASTKLTWLFLFVSLCMVGLCGRVVEFYEYNVNSVAALPYISQAPWFPREAVNVTRESTLEGKEEMTVG